MLDYLKLFRDMEQYFEMYSDDERGRLFTAMMQYAFHGEDTVFDGNERFIWPALRQHIDACENTASQNKANGSRGGRPAKPVKTPGFESETPGFEKKTPGFQPETPGFESETLQEQEHIQEQEQEQEQEYISARAREDAPAPAAEPITAFTGEDITEDVRVYDLADSMLRTYGMTENDQTRAALIEDIHAHGESRLREVLKEAALSNSRGKVSVKFYRAILNGSGGKKAARDAPDYQRRSYTAADYAAMAVDLDADDG